MAVRKERNKPSKACWPHIRSLFVKDPYTHITRRQGRRRKGGAEQNDFHGSVTQTLLLLSVTFTFTVNYFILIICSGAFLFPCMPFSCLDSEHWREASPLVLPPKGSPKPVLSSHCSSVRQSSISSLVLSANFT